jgi:hypothetical protein
VVGIGWRHFELAFKNHFTKQQKFPGTLKMVFRKKMKITHVTQKILLLFLFYGSVLQAQDDLSWVPYGRFTEKAIKESSGFVKSRQFENVFWTHNDSGDKPRIFATTEKGDLIREIAVPAAKNIDWEDIAVDNSGHLIIGDFGNNRNTRRDLTIYIVEEPNPYETDVAKVIKRVPFQFPDQQAYPDPLNMNLDTEAAFWANGHLYLLTKHRSDRKTKLYKFGTLENDQKQTITRIGEFEIDGMVTAADASPDGQKLVVLSYEYIYLFEKPKDSDNYLAGEFKRVLLEARQSEAIAFAGTNLLLTNEQREIYKLPLSYLEAHDSFLPPLPKIAIPKIKKYNLDGKSEEWSELENHGLALKQNAITRADSVSCHTPKVHIGWTKGGFLISIQNWSWLKTKKDNQTLLKLMFGLKNDRTVRLEQGAFVWDLVRSGENFALEQIYPSDLQPDHLPSFKMIENTGAFSLEILVPVQQSEFLQMESGNKCLFNLIINPRTPCEWYWASDSSMFSQANPYIWGEIMLQN